MAFGEVPGSAEAMPAASGRRTVAAKAKTELPKNFLERTLSPPAGTRVFRVSTSACRAASVMLARN
ncbi:hypothetical protein [Nocardia niigatensis]